MASPDSVTSGVVDVVSGVNTERAPTALRDFWDIGFKKFLCIRGVPEPVSCKDQDAFGAHRR